jgi:hypothetical protein
LALLACLRRHARDLALALFLSGTFRRLERSRNRLSRVG